MAARTGPAVSSPSAAVADEAATRRRDGAGKTAGDAGAEFVLESKGTWWHAGFHLTTAMGAINVGVTIGSILLAGNSLQIMYTTLVPYGPLKLYHFIVAVASVLALLSQMPSFHSLRYINLGSLVLSVGYTILVSAACIRAGLSSNAPAKDYSLSTSKSEKTFDAFLSVSILAAAFGNGILPEIQATLVPPAAGKMVKALVINYSVAFFTFYPLAITGYWAFGKTVQSNAIQSLMPATGPSLAPRWLLCLTVVLVLFQLLAIALLYAQVVYEVMEKRVADATRGRFSWRNLLPRVAMRTFPHTSKITPPPTQQPQRSFTGTGGDLSLESALSFCCMSAAASFVQPAKLQPQPIINKFQSKIAESRGHSVLQPLTEMHQPWIKNASTRH
uniref:Amino acid transporter transmembrane domain-containing protein n=1 Tax=Aegilops tauschii TaxID=37682 RepID=R7WF75_AEGTA